MNLDFTQLNWLAVIVCFVIGQVFLTLWFAVIFGDPWARAYAPGKTKAEHTKEVPGYTYGIGALCMLLLVLGIALLQSALGTSSIGDGISLALFLDVFLVASTMVPGYAFLRRWNAVWLALGSQAVVIVILSAVLAVWK